MGDKVTRGNSIGTIDVTRVTIQLYNEDLTGVEETEFGLDTASQITVAVDSQTREAIQLIIKDVLRFQKGAKTTITGNTITMTDNVFSPQLVQLLQGGEIEYFADGSFKSYTPLPTGASAEERETRPFRLNVYSIMPDAAGNVLGYFKVTYPNCTGSPMTISPQDGVFTVMTYTIHSYPQTSEPPLWTEVINSRELPPLEDFYILKRPEESMETLPAPPDYGEPDDGE